MSAFTIQADVERAPMLCNARVYHGDSWTLTFQLNDDAATAHDLTSATVAASAQDAQGATTALTASTGADPTRGTVTTGPPAGGLQPGVHIFDVQVTEGAAVTTWARGELIVTADVTP